MNVVSENIIDTSIEQIDEMIEVAIDKLIEHGGKIVGKIQKEYMPLLDDMLKNLSGELKGYAFGKEVGLLDMKTLVDFAKSYIVPMSNEIVAIKTKQSDGFYVYLTYSRDRQLLPTKDNKYLIIKAQALAKDVEKLFAESELVILK